ncbi:hypothetical protein, partial [Actinoplanes sp. DH11]|uniref:hypothetical protein n=1 Tax=Actinoplanes sp. DH11 TaxID=2857011 RepID=UPI001E2F83FD
PTHNLTRKTPAPSQTIGMKCKVMPGIEDQPQGLFFQIPNRVLITGFQPHQHPFHATEAAVLGSRPLPDPISQCLRL